jgi:hypothetical protein
VFLRIPGICFERYRFFNVVALSTLKFFFGKFEHYFYWFLGLLLGRVETVTRLT